MRGFIWRWILNAIALYLTAQIITGITLDGFAAVVVAALVWGFVNSVIRPVVNLIALPITILTVGLFTLVINGFLLWLVAEAVTGFYVDGILMGIAGALLLSIISSVLSAVFDEK
ncbi:phage holin family protein [Dethiobacter alkaliphilus]|uniref:Phage holin family protein n=1 Tax=Dethiobacter alkaliphilus AHT 1 TaxID=555088 RepID=C0GFA1_DETAL|nr:phage holin family protein [Dethiobacter alkaliphilus]EEG77861.1 membrane protein of unknown function [Dethiobacter alkaliphilus AHT 1]